MPVRRPAVGQNQGRRLNRTTVEVKNGMTHSISQDDLLTSSALGVTFSKHTRKWTTASPALRVLDTVFATFHLLPDRCRRSQCGRSVQSLRLAVRRTD
jgi:hypothetical protein